MNTSKIVGKPAGLFVLGSLYPEVTGGMEVFNFYFLNYLLNASGDAIYYLGEKKIENTNGKFVLLKKRWPVRFFYPFQFFSIVFRLRNRVQFACISYAEQSWIIAFTHSIVLKLFNIPYIVTIHWGKEPDWSFRFPFEYYFRHAFAVVGVSEPICTAFKKAIPDQDFIYIPPLIPFVHSDHSKSELKKQLGFNEGEKILLFVGSLKAMKNPDKIVDAFLRIGTKYLDNHLIRLILAGKGEMEEMIREKLAKLGLEKYIRLEGLVTRERMPDYYGAADAYIISSDYEGTSLSLLEAMFNRLIIIGSDAPGINKMLFHEKNALLYPTTDILELAEIIKKAFSDRSLTERLSLQAYEDFNQAYAYEPMMKKYQAIFSSITF
jgi:glycosyltransferase involved in cell wall biosynthesis